MDNQNPEREGRGEEREKKDRVCIHMSDEHLPRPRPGAHR